MEASADTQALCFFMADLIGFLFFCPLLNWVARIQKFYHSSCLPLLLQEPSTAASVVVTPSDIDDDSQRREEETTKSAASQPKSNIYARREDVEMVMDRMGLSCDHSSAETDQLKESLGAADLCAMFEDKEPSLEEVELAFSVFDCNGDGFIDAEELHRVLSMLGFKEASSVSACQRMIAVFDQNRDGRIDLHEFASFMETSLC